MKKEIIVPTVGESISEAIICNIIKPTGSYVRLDEEILEIETDKVNQVIYAPADGEVHLDVAVDDTVKIQSAIGYIDTSKTGGQAPSQPQAPKEEKKPEPVQEEEVAPPQISSEAPVLSTKDLRIPRDAFLTTRREEERSAAAPPIASTAKAPEAPVTRKRMSKIRQVIAERLVEVKNKTAMLTTFNEIDMGAVMELRSSYKERFEKVHGVRLGFMSFFLKASLIALQEIPEVNAYIDGNEIVYRNNYDIGVAVGTDRGLMVPVIRNVDQLSLAGIEGAIAAYAKQAREGKIALDSLQGGGFTITNGGVYGSLLSTPILNPPQSGILGLHRIQKRPVAVDDQVVIRPMMYVALSYDHRIIDGKEAVTFLVRVKEVMEDPTRFLLEV